VCNPPTGKHGVKRANAGGNQAHCDASGKLTTIDGSHHLLPSQTADGVQAKRHELTAQLSTLRPGVQTMSDYFFIASPGLAMPSFPIASFAIPSLLMASFFIASLLMASLDMLSLAIESFAMPSFAIDEVGATSFFMVS